MTKFQKQLSTVLRRFSLGLLFCAGLFLVAIHFVKIPMIEPWQPPVFDEKPVVEEVKIEIVYVMGNGVRVRDGPSEAHEPIKAYNWCKSLIVFSRDREWVEIGEIEPIGWMHEGFLTDEKPGRCKKKTQ